jgi:membrane protein YdbS with pleckstrin-like domain
LAAAMVLYNLGVVFILGVGIRSGRVGVALWPAMVLHSAVTIWCVASFRYLSIAERPANFDQKQFRNEL